MTKASKASPKKGISTQEAATRLGMTRQALAEWEKKGCVVRYPDRSVDFEQTSELVRDARHPMQGGKRDVVTDDADTTSDTTGASGKKKSSLTEARTRREIALAMKAELEVAKLKGTLVPLAEAEKVYLDVVAQARAALEAIPVRVMHRLVGLEANAIRQVLTDEIANALRGTHGTPSVHAEDSEEQSVANP